MILFGAIGCGNTLVDWGVYSLLYRFTAVLWLSQTVGYTAGLVNSYLLNRNLTFRDSRGEVNAPQLLRFVLVNLVTLGVSLLGLYLMVDWRGLNPYLSKLLTIAVVWPMNFIGYRTLYSTMTGREARHDGSGTGEQSARMLETAYVPYRILRWVRRWNARTGRSTPAATSKTRPTARASAPSAPRS